MDEPTLGDFIDYLRDHEGRDTVLDHPGIVPDLWEDFQRYWKDRA